MHKTLLALATLLAISVHSICGQAVNKGLKAELDSIYRVDQLYRGIMNSTQKKDSLAKANKVTAEGIDQLIVDRMMAIDRSNIERVKQIIKLYGYPGKTLVGTPTNEAAWNVIQHSEDIDHYFPVIKQAGTKKELPASLVAVMEDRLLVQKGKEQKYGTQVHCENSECYVWPVVNPTRVNQRRKQAGFDLTVEENAKRFGVEYKVRKLPKEKHK